MAKEAAATGVGRCFLAMTGTEVKEIPEFVVTPAIAIRRGGVTEPAHRTISALDPAMILLDAVVIRHNFPQRHRRSRRLGPPAVISGNRDKSLLKGTAAIIPCHVNFCRTGGSRELIRCADYATL
jgi:hypothetical protein